MFKKIRRYWNYWTHPIMGEVWLLHRVTNAHSDSELQRTYEITPSRLEALIVNFSQKGYDFISISEAADRMKHNSGIKYFFSRRKFISVTLDDGYADNYEQAYPIFRKYKIPFCIYLMQSEIIGDTQGNFPMLTIEQITELDKDPLCTLGGHTYSHPNLALLDKQKQHQEIEKCQRWIEGLTHHKIEDFSYPFGSFNQETIELLTEIGVKRCPMAWGGKLRKGTDNILLIPRCLITENTIIY